MKKMENRNKKWWLKWAFGAAQPSGGRKIDENKGKMMVKLAKTRDLTIKC